MRVTHAKNTTLLTYLFIALGLLPTYALTENVRVRGTQSQYDASHDYYLGLLKLAITKSGRDDITFSKAPYMVQHRALMELKAGRLVDIYWAGTNAEREDILRPIRIPLIKGLLGYRVMLTHKDNIPNLKKLRTKEQLQQYNICQGAHWPDTDIMLAAGLYVQPNPIYENMFRQTVAKRCDVFPRGINEAQAEYQVRRKVYPSLRLFSDTILYYPFPMYFFVNKNHETLAQTIEQGLEKAIDDGSFDQYLQSHPTTQHLFPLENWMSVHYIALDNPFLSHQTPTDNPRYWIQPPTMADKPAAVTTPAAK